MIVTPISASASPPQNARRNFCLNRIIAVSETHTTDKLPSRVTFAAVVICADVFHAARFSAKKNPATIVSTT